MKRIFRVTIKAIISLNDKFILKYFIIVYYILNYKIFLFLAFYFNILLLSLKVSFKKLKHILIQIEYTKFPSEGIIESFTEIH